MKTNLKALSEKELSEFIENLGQSPYRAKQIINWIYKKLASSFEEMTDLPKSLRKQLEEIAFIGNLQLLKRQDSKDGTRKFLFKLEDEETIESVLIPDKDRLTLCVSSQVGCAMGCKFCITGTLGLKRNLKAHEIVDQVISVQRIINDTGRKITNIVLMGMGEPLHNITEVVGALWSMVTLLGFSKRRITLSTVGIPPKIAELARKGPKVNLAISLNAATDEVRNRIMPVNKKYPLKNLIRTCKEFPLEPRRRITFEYVLIDKVNDSIEDASRLVKLLGGIKSKINLIPLNVTPDYKTDFRKPSEDRITTFQKVLLNAGITAIIRKSMGTDISAACGQLKALHAADNHR